ncbi:MAG TPA: thiamine diphosphokinase [Spirochaetia bacterium]|nr:thiamine diphosphokinase [Spirochaetia bacterium]
MTGLLFVGGEGPGREVLSRCAREAALSVAADSGLELALSAGIEPDLVVGDMDSLTDLTLLQRFPPDRVVRLPRDKDDTDTEVGLQTLLDRGADEVTIVGGGGGRMDHLLGIVSLFQRGRPPRRWLTHRDEIILVDRDASFEGWIGSTVSVFPVGERAARMRSTGLRWPLDGLVFEKGRVGISNIVTQDPFLLSVADGKLLVIRSRLEG